LRKIKKNITQKRKKLKMKILVFSDSHGNDIYMRKAIKMHPDAEAIIFLGDGIADFLALPNGNSAKLYVRGNCDWHPSYSNIPLIDSITLNSKKIVFLHGHTHGAKSGMDTLHALGKDMSADIVLFGHTHVAAEHYDDGIYYLNPGSIGGVSTPPTFGIITLRENGILLSHGVIAHAE
jgi:putative phosphoesterase